MTELITQVAADANGRPHPADVNDRAWGMRRQSPDRALELAREARQMAAAAKNERELARSLCIIGNLLAFSNNDGHAEGYLLEALSLSERLGDDATTSWTLYGLTKVAFRSGNLRGALGTAMRTFDAAKRAGMKSVEGNALNAMGAAYKDLGLYQEALKSFRRSLDVFKTIDQDEEFVVPLFNINLIYTELGEYRQALTYAEPALEMFERNGDAVNAAGALMNIGDLHANLDHYDKALECLHDALRRFRELDIHHYMAQAHYHLGKTLSKLGKLEQARSSYLSALEFYQQGQHDAARVQALIGLGELDLIEDNPDHAVGSLSKALAISEAKGLKKHLYQVHQGLSKARRAQGQLEDALDHFERFHTLKEEVSEEKIKSVMEGMQVQVDIEKEHHKLEVDRLTNRELAHLNQQLRSMSEQLEEQSILDELTRVYNRRHLNTELAKTLQFARRHDRPLSVVMCDIDHFKSVNDTYSHAVGDKVLSAVATLLELGTRTDMVARYGGEEFVMVLIDTPLDAALAVCERLRSLIEDNDWSRFHPDLRVTMSFGISERHDIDHHEHLLDAADAMLYRAKREGRNRVCA